MPLPAFDRELAVRIDHTLLEPDATAGDIERLCHEAVHYRFRAVCVMPRFARAAAEWLRGTPLGVAAVVGFPAGTMNVELKRAEALAAVRAGATELDLVAATGEMAEAESARRRGDAVLAERCLLRYEEEVAVIARAAVDVRGPEVAVKVILQTGLLRRLAARVAPAPDEAAPGGDALVSRAGEAAAAALVRGGVTRGFLKTCDGVYPGAATVEDVRLLVVAAGGRAGVKAAGGIGSVEQARSLIAAGADVLGTSRGVALVTGGALAAQGY